MTNRFYFTLYLCYMLALSACNNLESKSDEDTGDLPNILILTADDLAYNSIGAFGSKVSEITPNIDKFAQEGIRFTQAHVNTPVCQPCRQSILTGLFPHNNGAEGFEPIDYNVSYLYLR